LHQQQQYILMHDKQPFIQVVDVQQRDWQQQQQQEQQMLSDAQLLPPVWRNLNAHCCLPADHIQSGLHLVGRTSMGFPDPARRTPANSPLLS
jgi:hypothetical protein